MDAGLLLGRVILGALMAAHGSQKLFGWFGGYGLAGTGGFFESLGFRPGRLFAAVAGVSEVASGLLLALGLLGPIGPALMVAVMVVAAGSVHWPHGLFAATNGIEVPLLYGVGAAMLTLTGPGAYSLDALVGLREVWTPEIAVGALLVAIVGGFLNLALRKTAPQATAAQS